MQRVVYYVWSGAVLNISSQKYISQLSGGSRFHPIASRARRRQSGKIWKSFFFSSTCASIKFIWASLVTVRALMLNTVKTNIPEVKFGGGGTNEFCDEASTDCCCCCTKRKKEQRSIFKQPRWRDEMPLFPQLETLDGREQFLVAVSFSATRSLWSLDRNVSQWLLRFLFFFF